MEEKNLLYVILLSWLKHYPDGSAQSQLREEEKTTIEEQLIDN